MDEGVDGGGGEGVEREVGGGLSECERRREYFAFVLLKRGFHVS
jgi:hypothetical protein